VRRIGVLKSLAETDLDALSQKQNNLRPQDVPEDRLAKIVDLLRTKTAHDFGFYKQGTLRRRIERRMAMAAIKTGDLHRYLEMLRRDTGSTSSAICRSLNRAVSSCSTSSVGSTSAPQSSSPPISPSASGQASSVIPR
jgi:hypothetical protein